MLVTYTSNAELQSAHVWVERTFEPMSQDCRVSVQRPTLMTVLLMFSVVITVHNSDFLNTPTSRNLCVSDEDSVCAAEDLGKDWRMQTLRKGHSELMDLQPSTIRCLSNWFFRETDLLTEP